MKPVAYISKNGVLFKEEPPAPMDLEPLYVAPKPLTLELIDKIHEQGNPLNYFEFARAIERAHGIQ